MVAVPLLRIFLLGFVFIGVDGFTGERVFNSGSCVSVDSESVFYCSEYVGDRVFVEDGISLNQLDRYVQIALHSNDPSLTTDCIHEKKALTCAEFLLECDQPTTNGPITVYSPCDSLCRDYVFCYRTSGTVFDGECVEGYSNSTTCSGYSEPVSEDSGSMVLIGSLGVLGVLLM
eukprot:TRINITY_DN2674_c0_g2_i1.p1 TRINITY_DN2674_c0_g2~~TRINITY_DN2674_c0_g2_i1.p1  ORF type:complete len:174 (-),score=33.02 TRINITY_DN2674_c0_g2_i1:38-559(-)